MGSLRLHAIAIDEVREIFGAPESTATALRAIAADRFPTTPSTTPGLLAKLGPVFRRAPDAPVLRPGVPRSIPSLAAKCDLEGSGEPAACTTARCPLP